ncbi:hypothetical protein Tco_0584058 [Tanacetum coccineum]
MNSRSCNKEKRYPLTPPTITDMLNKKLQVDYFSEMGRIVRIKSLLNAASITAALNDVNAAQSKLVLLDNFNENYSKCLRLLYKVNVAEGVNDTSEEVSTAELVSTAYVICSDRQRQWEWRGRDDESGGNEDVDGDEEI